MSKPIKQMQMDSLKQTFGDVRDLVLLSITGISSVAENQMRLALRKKRIHLRTVKNSLVQRIFKEVGLNGLDDHLQGPTTVAWGSSSIADLSKELDAFIRKNGQFVKPKIAVADGAVVAFDAAKKFPTRVGAIARVAGLALAPASRLVGQLRGPSGRLAGQVKTLTERAPAEEAPAALGDPEPNIAQQERAPAAEAAAPAAPTA